jgi:predicted dehydrogenase
MALTTEEPINLVFLGCGFATRLHSKTLAGFKNDIRCYYASRDQSKAISFNQKYSGNGYFGSYEAAMIDPKIDVALIATPPIYHLDLAVQAMQAGKHVIVEKPPFLHAADFDIIRKAQAETKRSALVAENYFYKPVAIKLRKLLRAGLIGEVLFVHVNALKLQKTGNWRDDPGLSGGGALFEGGIHWINFIANLGLSVKSVRGLRPGQQNGIEKSMLVAIEYAEGAVGALYYSWEIPSLFKGLRLSKIYGRKGSITFESNGLIIIVNGVKTRVIIPKLIDIAGYKGMFRDFIHALRTGEEPQMTLELAQQDLKLVETIYQSLNKNS